MRRRNETERNETETEERDHANTLMMMMLLALVRPAGARSLCTTTLLPCLLLPNRPRSGPINSSRIPPTRLCRYPTYLTYLTYQPYSPPSSLLHHLSSIIAPGRCSTMHYPGSKTPDTFLITPGNFAWTIRSFRSFRKGQTCFFFFFFYQGECEGLSVCLARRCDAMRCELRIDRLTSSRFVYVEMDWETDLNREGGRGLGFWLVGWMVAYCKWAGG